MRVPAAIRVGLVGCGGIARIAHIPVLTRLAGARLVALADADPTRLSSAICTVHSATGYSDYRELLVRPDIEAVVIALPTHMHAAAASYAFAHRKHVYLEKPLATSLADAEEIVGGWRGAGTIGMVGFNYRFNPLFARLRSLLRQGRVGSAVGIRSVFSTSLPDMPEWKRARRSGGGVLLDLASHHIDLVRWLSGREIRSVAAELSSRRTEHDTAALQLTLDDGVIVQSFFSLVAVEEDRVEIYGASGKLTADRYRLFDVNVENPLARGRAIARALSAPTRLPYLWAKLRSPGHEPSYRAAMQHFVECVRGAPPVAASVLDGYAAAHVVAAAEQSALTRSTVVLSGGVMTDEATLPSCPPDQSSARTR